ncbi:MAG TPA: serine/threonine-protein kinase [Kofleriaceae bacterium]|nr:serine/threonine-protein kinase [Kofleriaceae bacterium]
MSPIARGGMATVYLAAHKITGERVALKVLHDHLVKNADFASRLYAEHRYASMVRHPGLLRISDARTSSDGLPYLVMEHLTGAPLGDIVEQRRVSLGEIIVVSAQVAAALAAMHASGVVHCDVKDDNVFVLEDRVGGWPRIKVIDFGVSRRAEDYSDDTAIAGTPWCMAPEQWQGRPQAASDVYALGCMLYNLITGVEPFDGTLPELMTAHLERRPVRPTRLAPIPLALDRLILRALAKQASSRPTMADMARELDALAAGYLVSPAAATLRVVS